MQVKIFLRGFLDCKQKAAAWVDQVPRKFQANTERKLTCLIAR